MNNVTKTIIVIATILAIAGIMILSNGHYNLNQKSDVLLFLKAYGSWLGDIVRNVADITAYVIKKPWLPS